MQRHLSHARRRPASRAGGWSTSLVAILVGLAAAGCSASASPDAPDASGGNPGAVDAATRLYDAGGGTGAVDAGGGTGAVDAGAQADAGVLTSLDAKAVGAYRQVGTTCTSGSPVSGDAMFLCPGGRVRGAGNFDSAVELMCGTYTTTQASMPGCTDKVGCYPKIHANVKDTLILGGQQDVATLAFDMLMNNGLPASTVAQGAVWRTVPCRDGSTGYAVLNAVATDVAADYCVSDACPASTGGGSGSCGTDCDCGHCWYCERSGGTGTCRYGGEGPYGCYRGCQ
jgi:hypothetical protein